MEGVTSNDDLFVGIGERIECVKKLFLGSVFPVKELNVVY